MRIRERDILRFISKVDHAGPMPEQYTGLGGCCHMWKASSRNGYGQFWIDGANFGAHVVSFAIANAGKSSKYVLHRCDTKLCVNPAHLFEGTHADNMADRNAKNRQSRGIKSRPKNPASGERNHLHKITAKQAEEIRAKYQPRTYSQRKLAREYGLSQATVGQLLRGETWVVGKSLS